MRREPGLVTLYLCVSVFRKMCNRCSSSSNETLGVEKIDMSGCKQIWKNNNILLNVDNACLWVRYFCVSLEISLNNFGVKSFLHCIFLVAREDIPVQHLLELDRVYMFVCVRVFVCNEHFKVKVNILRLEIKMVGISICALNCRT